MNVLRSSLAEIRRAIGNFPPLELHVPGHGIDIGEMYFPKSHAAALDPDRSLVIGNRGMGKSFWASALVQDDARKSIVDFLPESRLNENVEVCFGFAEAEGVVGVSRDELATLVSKSYSPEQIWRAVALPHIAKCASVDIPSKLSERVEWIANEPSDVRELMRTADSKLYSRRGKLVMVFDQLEQLSDDIERRAQLTKGILQLTLAFKSYRCLRAKIFMRPDHFADDRLFTFADASKIKGEALHLDWRNIDLYGLLYSRLAKEIPQQFASIAKKVGLTVASDGMLPATLRENEEYQHRLFDIIAGDAMGGGRNRGLPYTWLISHLADARNQVSPRTFLRALRFAAHNPPTPLDTAIDHLGIHQGVREASTNRIDDLKEDYPWVPLALDSLRGLVVPACQRIC